MLSSLKPTREQGNKPLGLGKDTSFLLQVPRCLQKVPPPPFSLHARMVRRVIALGALA